MRISIKNKSWFLAHLLALFSFLIFNLGCNGSKLSESGFGSITVPPSTPPAPPQTPVLPGTSNGLLDNATNFYVGVETSVDAIAHVHASTGFNDACGVSLDSTANKDITCYVEVPEGDLYAKNLDLRYNVPPGGMCRYLRRAPHWFYNYEVGTGPSSIIAQINKVYNASGDLSTVTYACDIDGNGTPTPAECVAPVEVTPDLSPTAASFKCVYDGTAIDKPNCCFGNYTLNLTISDDKTASAGGITLTTTNTSAEWGGDYKACIGGAGKTDWTAYGKNGLPFNLLGYTENGVNDKQVVSSALSLGVANNIHAANYYGGYATYPANHTHDGFVSAVTSTAPYFIAPIDDRSGSPIGSAQNSFEFQCLDEAFEILHRIRVFVRDWDTYPDYLAYISSLGVTAVPDRGGDPEPGTNCTAIANIGYLCNDAWDADDFLNLGLLGTYDTTAPTTKRANYFPRLDY